MSSTLQLRAGAALVALAPAALAGALVAHPHIPGRLPNHAAIAEAVLADPFHWAATHLATGVASGLIAVAFVLVARFLREAGEVSWSGFGLPCIVLGSVLYAILPGMEFAPWAAAVTGGEVEGAQAALTGWFLPLLLSSAFLFGVGAAAFALDVARSGLLSRPWARTVAAGLILMALSRFVPYMAVQMYVQGAAAFVALWPLAFAMWGVKGRTHADPTSRAADRAAKPQLATMEGSP